MVECWTHALLCCKPHAPLAGGWEQGPPWAHPAQYLGDQSISGRTRRTHLSPEPWPKTQGGKGCRNREARGPSEEGGLWAAALCLLEQAPVGKGDPLSELAQSYQANLPIGT